ncbi:hypothetical protein JMJ77_0011862, partial [Colletotrichum scovillei]
VGNIKWRKLDRHFLLSRFPYYIINSYDRSKSRVTRRPEAGPENGNARRVTDGTVAS